MNIKELLKKITSHSLAKDSLIVMIGSMISNIGAYFYHLVMGRFLGPTGYGELSSLLSIFYLYTVPLNVGALVLIKFISSMKAQNHLGQVQTLIKKITKISIIGCTILLPGILFISPLVSSFLHIQSTALFIIVYIIFVLSLLTVIVTSALQGYQKFFWVSIFGAGSVIVKLLISIPASKFGVYGVLLSMCGSTMVMYLLYFLPLRFIFQAKASPLTLTTSEALRYALPTLLITLGMTSLYSTDIILVRHFFSAHEAGLYASLAVLGKVIFYASSALSIVLFPVLSERTAKGERGNKLITTSLIAVAGVSIGITLCYFLFPHFIIGIFFGSSYVQGAPLLGLFGVFLVLYAIGNLFTTIYLALSKLTIWLIPVLCACIQIIGITFYHDSLVTVIWVNILSCLILVLCLFTYYMVTPYEKI